MILIEVTKVEQKVDIPLLLKMKITKKQEECLIAKQQNHQVVNPLHKDFKLVYQRDFYPGLAIRGDEDVVELNEIVYLNPDKVDFSYSQIGIEETAEATIFQNYPNPATTQTSFIVDVDNSGKAIVIITNALGQNISTSQFDLSVGKNKITLDVSNLDTGIYFYTTRYDGVSTTKRMIVN